MKKILVLLAAMLFAAGFGLPAQSIFFPSKVGTVLTYANGDAKGNAQSYSMLTIKDVKGASSNMTITYAGISLDRNRKPLKNSAVEQTFKVVIKDDVVIMDLNQMIPPEMKQQGVKLTVKGTPLELPSSLKPGQLLKPYNLIITMDLGMMKMDSAIKAEGKCLAIEDVKVPAGTFKCHKITQKITSTAMNTTTVTNASTWYAPNVGTVKTETYDDKGKLTSTNALVELRSK